jgi:hypothetical protein
MPVTHQAATAVVGLEIGVPGEERGYFGLNGLGEQAARSVAENFGERIAKRSWLNQWDDIIVGHGVSSFGGEVAGLNHRHDTPPSSLHAVTNFRA